jgi:hypothetical protein
MPVGDRAVGATRLSALLEERDAELGDGPARFSRGSPG